jgi:two-component system NarL family sensor kinase
MTRGQRMMGREHSGRRARWLAVGLAGLAIAEVVTAALLSIIVGWAWRDALEAFVVTNSLMGVAFASCGGFLAWHRPRNPIGWLFVIAGLAHATTAAAAPAIQLMTTAEAPLTAQRLLVTLFAWSWPWSIGLCLPLARCSSPTADPRRGGGIGWLSR